MSKKEMKKLDDKIEIQRQKDMARMQLEAAKEIAMKGFSRYGIRDFFENRVVQAALLAAISFVGLYFGTGLLFFLTRNFQLELLFTGELISGIPNFIWWIVGAALSVAIITLVISRKKKEAI